MLYFVEVAHQFRATPPAETAADHRKLRAHSAQHHNRQHEGGFPAKVKDSGLDKPSRAANNVPAKTGKRGADSKAVSLRVGLKPT